MDDARLVEAFLEQNRRGLGAYNSIVKKYESLVFSVCFKYLRTLQERKKSHPTSNQAQEVYSTG